MGGKILFLSNGHGEDTVGARIASEVMRFLPSLEVQAMPVVGRGEPYEKIGVTMVGPRLVMPSGGLIWRRPFALLRDIRVGFLNVAAAQIRTLKRLSSETDLVIGVGDKVILFLNAWFLKRPMVFVGLADSKYYAGTRRAYTRPERRIMRRWCRAVFTRDALTAEDLNENGVGAEYVGNPMMDTFTITGEDFGLSDREVVVGILPGSRSDAYVNSRLIFRVVLVLTRRLGGKIGFVMALAPTLSLEEMARGLSGEGWSLSEVAPWLWAFEDSVEGKGAKVLVTRTLFGDVLAVSRIVIGLAGTANEQAAGMGRPVITFPGKGEQINDRFVRGQKKLLGDAVEVVEGDEEAIADAVIKLVYDEDRYERMACAGRERMGAPGASMAIAKRICDILGEDLYINSC